MMWNLDICIDQMSSSVQFQRPTTKECSIKTTIKVQSDAFANVFLKYPDLVPVQGYWGPKTC